MATLPEDEPMFAADLRERGNLAEAYGRLKGAIDVTLRDLEFGVYVKPERFGQFCRQLGDQLRDALQRAESVRQR